MAIRELSQELKEKAEMELNEVEEKVNEDIKHIKEWLHKQPHLIAREDDQWILYFLRRSKFSLEKTKEKIDGYYTAKNAIYQFRDLDSLNKDVQIILASGSILPIMKTFTATSPAVVILRMGMYNPLEVSSESFMKVLLMLANMIMNKNDVPLINGTCIIYDMADVNIHHAINLEFLRKMFRLYSSYPIRVKSLHFLNMPDYFETFFNLIKPLMGNKLMLRTKLHSKNSNAIHEIVPNEILPKAYNGEGEETSEIIDFLKNTFEASRDWFLEEMKYTVDETKRPKKPNDLNSIYGIDGSFKQLVLD